MKEIVERLIENHNKRLNESEDKLSKYYNKVEDIMNLQ